MLDNASVRKAAEHIKSLTKKIDVLINNAGIMAPKEYATSKDGIESQFAANHVGHFLLTGLLIEEVLAAGEGAAIINVASLGYQLAEPNLDDPNFEVSSSTSISFSHSKTLRVPNYFFRTASPTTDGGLMGNRRPQTYSTPSPWVRSSAAKISPSSPSIPVVSVELQSLRLPRKKA